MEALLGALVEELVGLRGLLVGGEYRLRSGRVSRIYVDLRRLYASPRGYRAAALLLASRIASLDRLPDAVVGVATGGIGWAVLAASMLGLPSGYVRPEAKDHGTGRLVEGPEPPARLVLVDDVATTGGALAEAVEAARRAGFDVEAAVVIVDRCMGARERLEALGVAFHHVATIADVVEAARRLGVDVSAAEEELRGLRC